MTGAIPRSLMTAGELIEADLDEQREIDALDDDAYVPTAADVAHTFTGLLGDPAAGESTGATDPEGRERPEGDATRGTDNARPGLLARRHNFRPYRDELLILAIGLVMCALAIAVIAASAEPGWFV